MHRMDAASRPLIAVTTSEMRSAAVDVPTAEADPPRREMALGMRYLEALERVGGLPVVVPPLDAAAIEALLDRVDGVCLSGGPDIDPALYGAEPDAALGPVEPPLDAAELALARAADARAMPILGVCRGAQLLNVARGGTLHQHLPDAVPAALEHRQPAEATAVTHHVDVQPGSRLAGVLGATRADVNSFHHQGTRDLGRGLLAVAWAPDGTVEAIEATDRGFALGVQWHVECLTDRPEHHAVFQAFVEACRGVPRRHLASVALT
jgi:putative glutamine amidotransferase